MQVASADTPTPCPTLFTHNPRNNHQESRNELDPTTLAPPTWDPIVARVPKQWKPSAARRLDSASSHIPFPTLFIANHPKRATQL